MLIAALLSQRAPSKDVLPQRDGSAASAPASDGADRAVAASLDLNHSTLPAIGAAGAFLDCGVEADGDCGSGYAWHCYDSTGAAVAVTNECGNGTELGPFVDANGAQQRVMARITVATAPYIAGATAAAIGLPAVWTAAYTAVYVSRPTTAEDANPILLTHGLWTTHGIRHQPTASGRINCYHMTGAAAPNVGASAGLMGAWQVRTCSYSGSTMTARVDGNVNSGALAAPVAPLAAQAVQFGSDSGQALGGPLARVLIYDRQLSAAELTALEAQAQGLTGRPANAVVDADSTRYVLDASGQYQAMGQDFTVAQPDGVDIYPDAVNYWTNSLDASAWTDVGTPTITVNQGSGPFSIHNLGAEADRIDDNDAGAQEGKESASAGTATGSYTASCHIAAGTASDYTLSIVTDGTGGGSCTGTGLTSSYVRKTCSPTAIGGSPTYVRARVLVGDAVGDTGTILVSDCELTKTTGAVRPCLAAGSATTCNGDNVTVAATNWPVGHGRADMTYAFGPYTTLALSGSSRLLLQLRNSGNSALWMYYLSLSLGLQAAAPTIGYTFGGGGSWSSGTSYDLSVRWPLTGTWSAVVDQAALGTAAAGVPTGTANNAALGRLINSGTDYYAQGRLSRIRVIR